MAENPAAEYTDEYRRETADYIISTGRPAAVVAREPGLNPKTANRWVKDRRDRLSGAKPTESEEAELKELRKRVRELEMENDTGQFRNRGPAPCPPAFAL